MIKIYFKDLSAEKQAEIFAALGDVENLDIIPIAEIKCLDLIKEKKAKLLERMENEYKEFYNETLCLSTEKIWERAYEKVMKEDLILAVSEMKLSREETESLMKEKTPLNALYMNWLKSDSTYMDEMRDSISYYLK